MQTNITTERGYTIGYYRPASKTQVGITIQVVGDHKSKVVREAQEIMRQATEDAKEFDIKVVVNADNT
jgi:2'-5' RNA ligase